MGLIKISEEHFVDPLEVSSVEGCEHWEDRGTISQADHYLTFKGSVVVMKNGRKIYVKGVQPNAIVIKLGWNETPPADGKEVGSEED